MAWAEQLLGELGRRANLSLNISAQGTCSLTFGNEELFFEIRDELLFIMADLGSSHGMDTMFRELLEGCNLGAYSAFGSIGIDEVRHEFVMTRVLSAQVDYEDFEQLLSLFVRTVRQWKSKLEKYTLELEAVEQPKGQEYYNSILP
ncbi:MAG: type III secretion system chaperone [Succinivibrio sp.]|nr:type III secretion system chaperone [Succinivibrio sp.]